MLSISKREALAGYEAASFGSLVLRPFAPSGAPSVLPRAPSLLPLTLLYTPRTLDWRLPFPFEKGSIAALEGAPREQRGSKGEHEGSRGSIKESVMAPHTGRVRSTEEPEMAAS